MLLHYLGALSQFNRSEINEYQWLFWWHEPFDKRTTDSLYEEINMDISTSAFSLTPHQGMESTTDANNLRVGCIEKVASHSKLVGCRL